MSRVRRDPSRWRALMFGALTSLAVTSRSLPAQACSGGGALPTQAIPRPLSADVSIHTSVVVMAGRAPPGLLLSAAGQEVTPIALEPLGPTVTSSMLYGSLWRLELPHELAPATEYVLTALTDATAMTRQELTRFTTARGDDKTPGSPPRAHGLELWRVRYPLREINSGNCVFGEYRGYIRLPFDTAAVPHTAPDGTVYALTLAPKTGGAAQSFHFTGDDLFHGNSPEGNRHLMDRWHPELDPTREYCATLSALGDGNLARPALVSEPVCARVAELASEGVDAGASGGPTEGDAGAAGGSRCGGARRG